jgi:hypothetical protein
VVNNAAVWEPPASIAVTGLVFNSPEVSTGTGALESVALLFPNWPEPL